MKFKSKFVIHFAVVIMILIWWVEYLNWIERSRKPYIICVVFKIFVIFMHFWSRSVWFALIRVISLSINFWTLLTFMFRLNISTSWISDPLPEIIRSGSSKFEQRFLLLLVLWWWRITFFFLNSFLFHLFPFLLSLWSSMSRIGMRYKVWR